MICWGGEALSQSVEDDGDVDARSKDARFAGAYLRIDGHTLQKIFASYGRQLR
jgi:hypothetical protein